MSVACKEKSFLPSGIFRPACAVGWHSLQPSAPNRQATLQAAGMPRPCGVSHQDQMIVCPLAKRASPSAAGNRGQSCQASSQLRPQMWIADASVTSFHSIALRADKFALTNKRVALAVRRSLGNPTLCVILRVVTRRSVEHASPLGPHVDRCRLQRRMAQNRLHDVGRHLARDGARAERMSERMRGGVGQLQQILGLNPASPSVSVVKR